MRKTSNRPTPRQWASDCQQQQEEGDKIWMPVSVEGYLRVEKNVLEWGCSDGDGYTNMVETVFIKHEAGICE